MLVHTKRAKCNNQPDVSDMFDNQPTCALVYIWVITDLCSNSQPVVLNSLMC